MAAPLAYLISMTTVAPKPMMPPTMAKHATTSAATRVAKISFPTKRNRWTGFIGSSANEMGWTYGKRTHLFSSSRQPQMRPRGFFPSRSGLSTSIINAINIACLNDFVKCFGHFWAILETFSEVSPRGSIIVIKITRRCAFVLYIFEYHRQPFANDRNFVSALHAIRKDRE